MSASDWDHDALAEDLRSYREQSGRIAVTQLSLGSWGLAGQMDVACIGKSRKRQKIAPTCWEVKVSRQDFRADVTAGKYERYLPFVSRLYFATPSGLVSRDEIPLRMGWATRNENGWSVIQAPTMEHPTNEGMLDFLIALLLRRADSPWRRERSRRERAEALDKDRLEDFYQMYPSVGTKVEKRLREAARVQHQYQSAKDFLRSELQKVNNRPLPPEDTDLRSLVRALLDARPRRDPTDVLSEVKVVRRQLERQVKRLRGVES